MLINFNLNELKDAILITIIKLREPFLKSQFDFDLSDMPLTQRNDMTFQPGKFHVPEH